MSGKNNDFIKRLRALAMASFIFSANICFFNISNASNIKAHNTKQSSIKTVQNTEEDLKKSIEDLLTKSFAVLGGNQSEGQKIEEVKKLLQQNLDIETISMRVLGKFKKTLAPAELSEFKVLFREYVLSFCSKGIKMYNGQNVVIENVLYNKESDIYNVKTEVVDKEKNIVKVEYQVKYSKTEKIFKITDVITNNISMLSNLRAQFVNVLSETDGFAKLKKFLQTN